LFTCALFILPGCGSAPSPLMEMDQTPADVHGMYALNVTNGPSTCPLQGWTQGAVTTNVPLSVSQNAGSVSADVGGAGTLFLDLWCGNAHLAGSISGSDLELTLTGTRSLSSGACAFTVDARVSATVSDDTLSGSITYTPNTNSSPDCAGVNACTARMNLNGTRPPSSN
jgi:hypothetical protein